jgi:hypothetical protein
MTEDEHARKRNLRVLLTEGSSLTSREIVTCLGSAGYHLEVVDPDPFCISRFSRWVHRVHRCPSGATDPVGYLDRLTAVVAERSIDVVLPTHEQAWLLAVGRSRLPENLAVAVATAEAFDRVQSKIEFARLLDELGAPQPRWRPVEDEHDVADLGFPFWLKAPFSTAGQGVRHVTDERTRDAALAELSSRHDVLMAQEHASGRYGQVQALFDHGRLVAVHTSVQVGTGMGGSAAARLGVDHPEARHHAETVGGALAWHGGLTLDYLHEGGSPCFIECNPRTVEPANATASGVNIPDLQVQLSAGRSLPPSTQVGRPGTRTHSTLALLLGVADRTGSRRSVQSELRDALTHRRQYESSTEELTPILRDPPSLVPLMVVAAQLLASPRRAERISRHTVATYSIGPDAIAKVRNPRET